jgi:outer membrane protein assembly factor BamC
MKRLRMTRHTMVGVLAGLLIALCLPGCSTVEKAMPGDRADYKTKGRTGPPLEIPPDLSSSTIEEEMVIPEAATASEYSAGVSAGVQPGWTAVLPDQPGMQIRRDGDKRWLVVEGTPDAVWSKVRDFWTQAGFLIQSEDPKAGVMRTDWAENRADIPKGGLRKLLGKVSDFVYSAATRDRYTTRLERGEQPDTTEVYITHYGVEEVVQGPADEQTAALWRPRPNDPELEAEMLQRLLVSLGTQQEMAERMVATAKDRAREVTIHKGSGGETWLVVQEGFSQAWRNTGIALDRIGFTVEDRNRSEGVYFVRYNDPVKEQSKGFMDKLAFWKADDEPSAQQYRIKMLGEGAETRIMVEDKDGEADNSSTARRILTLLQEQLQK